MRAIVTGGTGFIGKNLCLALLARGWEVVVPSRSVDKVRAVFSGKVRGVASNSTGADSWSGLVDRDTAVVNLAGENIASGRWTPDKKRRILESRVHAGLAVVRAVAEAPEPPAVVVQGSAAGYYGTAGGSKVLTEKKPPGQGFLAGVAQDWEQSTRPLEDSGVRRVVIRTGMVLGRGGALARMLPPFRLGLGGPVGAGDQFWPWIHMDDAVAGIIHLLETPGCHGPFNLCAPKPVTSAEFAHALGRALSRPAVLPLPAFAARMIFGEMATELLLGSQRTVPEALLESGFSFTYPELGPALDDLA